MTKKINLMLNKLVFQDKQLYTLLIEEFWFNMFQFGFQYCHSNEGFMDDFYLID